MDERDIRRARLYGTLAAAFDRPDETVIATVEDGSIVEELSTAATVLEGQEATAGPLADALPADAGALRSAYAEAFGNENEATVSQYETEYAPGTLVTNTDQLADMAGFYRAFGLDVASDSRDRPDYLPTQLEFATHLLAQRAYLRTEADETGVAIVTDAWAAFVEDHLGRWVPRFADAVHEEVDAPFYRVLADLLEALLEDETERLGVSPDVFEAEPTAPLESVPGLERDEEGRLATSCGSMASGSGVNGR